MLCYVIGDGAGRCGVWARAACGAVWHENGGNRCYSHPLECPRATTRATSSGARRLRGHALSTTRLHGVRRSSSIDGPAWTAALGQASRRRTAAASSSLCSARRLAAMRASCVSINPRGDANDLRRARATAATRDAKPVSLIPSDECDRGVGHTLAHRPASLQAAAYSSSRRTQKRHHHRH
jgi:hypothetical protein